MSFASKSTANTTYSVAQQIHKSLSSAVSSAATAIVQPLPPGAPGTAGVPPRHRSQLFNRNVTTTATSAATPMLSQLSQPSPYPQSGYAMQPSTPYQPAPTTPYNAYAVPLIPGVPGPYGNIPTTPGQAYHTGQPGMGAYGVPPPPNATPGRPTYPPQPTQQRR